MKIETRRDVLNVKVSHSISIPIIFLEFCLGLPLLLQLFLFSLRERVVYVYMVCLPPIGFDM